MFTEGAGNIFDAPGVDAYMHGCNSIGAMGAGIAAQFRYRYPDMYEAYRDQCQQGALVGGDVFVWKSNGIFVYNMITQTLPGPNAKALFISEALRSVRYHALRHGVIRIASPAVGCGIGGLDLDTVSPLYANEFGESSVDVCLYLL